jgi:putative PIN family toxin of toxin-antitoxin system
MLTPSSTKRETKIVLDTNVWISALIWGGNPAEIIETAKIRKISIFTTEEIIREINAVLLYPKIKNTYDGTGLTHQDFIVAILKTAKIVNPKENLAVVQDHAADNKIIECAAQAKADYIISGDKDLLNLIQYKNVKIISSSEFLKVLTTKRKTKTTNKR